MGPRLGVTGSRLASARHFELLLRTVPYEYGCTVVLVRLCSVRKPRSADSVPDSGAFRTHTACLDDPPSRDAARLYTVTRLLLLYAACPLAIEYDLADNSRTEKRK